MGQRENVPREGKDKEGWKNPKKKQARVWEGDIAGREKKGKVKFRTGKKEPKAKKGGSCQ